MKRQIIHIDEEKCNGCGLCAGACHEGAIEMVNGKAKLTREDYCDGLGDCLPGCPTGAITFEEREAPAYDAAAVLAAKLQKASFPVPPTHSCPGSQAVAIDRGDETAASAAVPSRLHQWPVQIRLAPVNAPWLRDADLLIAADCTAYAYGNFHNDFIRDRITLVGCPKLDAVDYSEKLSAIFAGGGIRSITLTRMTVPCCGGMEFAIRRALERSGRDIPFRVVTIDTDGSVLPGE